MGVGVCVLLFALNLMQSFVVFSFKCTFIKKVEYINTKQDPNYAGEY